MTQVYFHCSNTRKVFVDHRGAAVDDPAEARDHATRVVQSFTNERSLEDWRDWVLHVSDDQGEELFIVPFTFVLGKPHCLQGVENEVKHDLLKLDPITGNDG